MNDRRRKAKILIIIGASAGALLSMAITFLMDVMYAEALQGTWREAIAKDINNLFSFSLTPDHILVYLSFGFVLLVLAIFGAILGVMFVMLIYRFLVFLGS